MSTQASTEVLLPFQKAWIADESTWKLCVKSRQIGMTWTTALGDVLLASSSKEAGGQDCWMLCQREDDTEEFIRDCKFWAEALQLVAEEFEEEILDPEDATAIQVKGIRFASGFRIRGLIGHPRALRGKRGKITFDEAAHSQHAAEFMAAASAFEFWGGRVEIVSTEWHEDTEFHQWRMAIERGDKGFEDWSLHKITIDDALAQGFYRRICQKKGIGWTQEGQTAWRSKVIARLRDKADSELFCIPIGASDIYITRQLCELNADPSIHVARWHCPKNLLKDPQLEETVAQWCRDNLLEVLEKLHKAHRHSGGMDFGRSGDVTSIVFIGTATNGDMRTEFLVELGNCPHKAQELIVEYILARVPKLGAFAMDLGGVGHRIAEETARQFGTQVKPVTTGNGKARKKRHPTSIWWSEMFPPVKQLLEDKQLPIPQDPFLVDDLGMIRVINGAPTLPSTRVKKAGQQRHGDTAVALAMAVWACETGDRGTIYGVGDNMWDGM